MWLVNHRGLGKANHVDTQNARIQEASKAGEEGRREREPSRLNDETAAETENQAAHEPHGS